MSSNYDPDGYISGMAIQSSTNSKTALEKIEALENKIRDLEVRILRLEGRADEI